MTSSEFDYNEISNSPNSGRTFSRDNVFYMELINETAFEIIVGTRSAADIRVPAGKTRKFFGHPLFPTSVNLKVKFNTVAPAPVTDFLTIITSQTNGCKPE